MGKSFNIRFRWSSALALNTRTDVGSAVEPGVSAPALSATFAAVYGNGRLCT